MSNLPAVRTGPAPVSQTRAPQQGKIRWGVKDKQRGFPKSLDTFRFTSPDKRAIEALAAEYGGEVRPWDEKAAGQRNQWEVISKTNDIEIWITPQDMFKGYEHWQGGICVRRCDGEECVVPVDVPNGVDYQTHACPCDAAGAMTCKPKIRMQVILPVVPLGGTWMVESGGWAAWHEMPDMMNMLAMLQGNDRAIEPGRLLLEDHSRAVREGGKTITKRFKVPKIVLPRTASEILTQGPALQAMNPGQTGTKVALPGKSSTAGAPELTPTSERLCKPLSGSGETAQDDIIDAEILDERPAGAGPWPRVADAAADGYQRGQLEKRSDGLWHIA